MTTSPQRDAEITDRSARGGGPLISDQGLAQCSGWFPALFTHLCSGRLSGEAYHRRHRAS